MTELPGSMENFPGYQIKMIFWRTEISFIHSCRLKNIELVSFLYTAQALEELFRQLCVRIKFDEALKFTFSLGQ